jgi:drug/metabolite transporter (DMT)-like permease
VLAEPEPQAGPVPRRLPALALAATIVLWGSAFAAIRAALEHFSPADLGALRLLIAAVVLGVVAAARGVRLPARRDVLPIAGVALTGMTAYQLLLNSGERTVPAGTASLLVNVSPVFTALAASALLHERMSARRWTGVAIAFAGATLIAVTGPGGLSLQHGALLVLGAAAAQAAFFVGQKPLLRRDGSLELTSWAMALGALMTLPLAPGLPAAVASAPADATLAVVYLGVGASAIGFVTWAYACARIDVSIAAATLYAVPVVAFSAGAVWLGERPTALALAGGGIALAGVALVTLSRAQPEAAQHKQRAAAERARLGQDAERDARAVGVEERAHAEQPLVAQLGEEHDVDDDEAVGGCEAVERTAMGAE